MIVRTYGRRNPTITKSYSDGVVLGSQESSQDVYNFEYSSQESLGQWSDLNVSSQESKELAVLPTRRSRENGVYKGPGEGYSWKSKKVKMGEGDAPEIFGFNTSQESGEFGFLPWRKGGEMNVNSSDEGYIGTSNVIKIDDESDPYGYNSLQESTEFKNVVGDIQKSKKGKDGKGKENGVLGKKKKKKKEKEKEVSIPCKMGPTVTLMETQEFGEMMEHMDEVNFALDGLKRGQPVRIRRASLLSLLSICGSSQQRRLLRAHGLAKTIIKCILGLSFDDSPSNLAAAALFYVLTSDGQDDNLSDSPSCIHFLIKLLKPVASDAGKVKAPTIGSKLLALRMDANCSQDSEKGLESTTGAIFNRVQEILISCKEIKLEDGDDNGNQKPELNQKWISLLTMEKACLSRISIEDTSGFMRKTGGNFKEKLRELGGLDAVFEVARSCHNNIEGWSEQSLSSLMKSKDKAGLESLVLLLKCLKIMENATFLSKDNQSHLLGMKGHSDNNHAPRSFVKLVLSIIKILSDVSLRCSLGNTEKDKSCSQISESNTRNKEDSNEILSVTSSVRCCTLGRTSSQPILIESQNGQWLTSGQPGSPIPASETTTASASDSWSLKVRLNSSKSGSCSVPSLNLSDEMSISEEGSRMKFGASIRQQVLEGSKFNCMEDSQDPFSFDEDDLEPSKWDFISGRKKAPQTQSSRVIIGEHEDGSLSPLMLSKQESSNKVASSSFVVDEKASSLLSECLLTAVKVLMNLTNDNPLGCQQIASSGGLETLSLLIADHFPSFRSCSPASSMSRQDNASPKSSSGVNHQNDRHFSDRELDFLVAVLGLLVNLVEKDSCNRSRLAAVNVSSPVLESLDERNHGDVIPMLCSIFVANQGAGEVAEEGRSLSWDDEDAISQGEKEAEKMIIEAYAALLLAFLSTESKSIRRAIADCLPDHNLAIVVPVLERFVEFHMTLNMISPETHTTVLEVIESCRIP